MLIDRWLVICAGLPITVLWVLLVATSPDQPYVSLFPVVLIGAAGIVWSITQGTRGHPIVLLTLLAINVALLNYRVRVEIEPPDMRQQDINWQNYVKLAVWCIALLVCVVNWRQIARLWRDPPFGALAAFILLSFVSFIWSVKPVLSLGSALGPLSYLLFGTFIVIYIPQVLLVRVMIWSLAGWLIINWFSLALLDIALMTDEAIPRFRGLAGHPNALGLQAATFLCLLIPSAKQFSRRYFWLMLLALGLLTLLATQSRTMLLSLTLSYLLVRFPRASVALVLFAGVAFIMILMTGQMEMVVSLLVRPGDSDVLAGRSDFWEYFVEKAWARPWFGYGFNTFEDVMTADINNNPLLGVAWVPGHPHNNFFTALFHGGMITLIPLVLWAVFAVMRWLRSPDSLRDLLVLSVLIGSFTDVSIAGPATLVTLILVIVMATDAKQRIAPCVS